MDHKGGIIIETRDKEELLKSLEKYLEDLKQLHKTNPELAKKKAKEALQRTGMLDKTGNFLPPYNGQKVNQEDFTMGPGETTYPEEIER